MVRKIIEEKIEISEGRIVTEITDINKLNVLIKELKKLESLQWMTFSEGEHLERLKSKLIGE